MSRNYGGTMVANLFVKFGADTEEYQKKMRAAVTRMLFAAESLTQAGRILSTAVTAPMLMIGAASLKTAMQFESAMTRMVSLVGMPAETIARWKPVVQDMAGVVGKSANELAEALFFITSNGIQSDQALKVLGATAKASAVGLGETKDVAIAATSALNAYGSGAMTANESVAVLIGTIREGNLEAVELPSALSRLLPIASAMGIKFHEAGAGIAAMSRSGTSARLAAFGMRAIMLGIQAPTKGAADAMDKVNLSASGLKRTIREEGLITALLQMNDATKTSDVTLRDLFPNQKAYVAALQLLGENVEDNVKIFKNMSEVVGEDVDKAFKVGAKTMERTYKQAMGDLSSTAIDLGENLAPLIDKFGDLAKSASKTARAYNELNDFHKSLIDSLAFAAIAIGPVLYTLGSLARITARFTGLSILFKAAWIQNAAAMMGANKAASSLQLKLDALGMTKQQLAGSIGIALFAGYQFGKWLDDTLGITEKLNESIGRMYSSLDSVTDGMAKSEAGIEGAVYAARQLAVRLDEVELSTQLLSAAQAGNTVEIAKLIKKINEKAQAYNRATIRVEGLTDAEGKHAKNQQALADAQAELDAEEGERLKKLREAHDLMTSQDVKDAMAQLIHDRKDLIAQGIPLNKINKEQVDELKKLAAWSQEYGIRMSNSIKETAASMNETGDINNSDYYKMFDYYIPRAVNAMPGKVIPGMVKIGDEAATQLTRGFGRGFEGAGPHLSNFGAQLRGALMSNITGAFDSGLEQLPDRVRETVEKISGQGITIPVYPDEEIWVRFFQDMAAGVYPDTRG